MKNNKQIIHELLLKYDMAIPVPPETRAWFEKKRTKNLKKILKESGRFSLWTALILLAMSLLRKTGFGLSYLKCVIVVATGSAIIAGGFSAGTYFAAKKIIQYINEDKQAEQKSLDEKKQEQHKQALAHQTAVNKSATDKVPDKKRIYLAPLESASMDKKELAALDTILKNNLKEKVQIVKNTRNSRIAISGSVEKMDNKYIISVKIIKSRTSKIIDIINKEINIDDDLENSFNRLAHGLLKKVL